MAQLVSGDGWWTGGSELVSGSAVYLVVVCGGLVDSYNLSLVVIDWWLRAWTLVCGVGDGLVSR